MILLNIHFLVTNNSTHIFYNITKHKQECICEDGIVVCSLLTKANSTMHDNKILSEILYDEQILKKNRHFAAVV